MTPLITPEEEPGVRLLLFAAVAIVIGANGWAFEDTTEATGVFDGYGNPIPPLERAKFRAETLHLIRAVSKAVGDAVVDEAKRLDGERDATQD